MGWMSALCGALGPHKAGGPPLHGSGKPQTHPPDHSKETSQMSSSSGCIRSTRHLHKTASHIVPGGAANQSVQCCRALASTTACSFVTSQMSVVPWNLPLWYEVSSPETTQGGRGVLPACFVTLGCWQPKTHSLLFCQLLYLGYH